MLNINLNKFAIACLFTSLLFSCSSHKEEDANKVDSTQEALGKNDGSALSEHEHHKLKHTLAHALHNTVFFAYDSSELSNEAKEVIDNQAKHTQDKKVIVEGHCDERGTAEYNMALGHKRAHQVKKELIKNGSHDKHIKIVSYGKSKPAVEGDNELAYKQNRRAVIIIENENK